MARIANEREDIYREHKFDISDRLALAKSWLDECLTSHQSCGFSPTELPSRLLDVLTTPIRVIENNQVKKFAALSYCWGQSGNLKTMKGNLVDHMKGIPLEKLPRTITDAITIRRALELNFLWVDALCIL